SIPRFLAMLSLAAALAAPVGHAADDMVTLNFVNADIDAVVKAVAEMTGRNFILDPKVKGVVNIVSARPVPKSLVYPTLLSSLRSMCRQRAKQSWCRFAMRRRWTWFRSWDGCWRTRREPRARRWTSNSE